MSENLRKKYHFVKVDIKIPVKILIDGYTEEFEINISDLLIAVLHDKDKVKEAIEKIKGIQTREKHSFNY